MSTKFTGAVNSEWYNPGNWSGGSIPDGSTLIVLDGTSPDCHLDFGAFGSADAEAGVDFTGYTGTLTNSGPGFRLNAGGTVTTSAGMTAPTLQLIFSGGGTVNSPTLNLDLVVCTGGTVTLAATLHATTLSLNGGNFDAAGHDVQISGDIGGGFGGVISGLDGTAWAAATFNVNGSDMVGASTWTLHVGTSGSFHNCTITDCNASGGVTVQATDNCVNGGGNTNVSFGAAPPAPVTTAAEAQTLSDLEAAVNTFLATLTDTNLNYVDIAAFVDDRRIGTDLRAVITTTPGGAALATPFVLKTFFGVSNGDGSCLSIVQAAIQAFLDAHTGYFIAAPRLIFIDVAARQSQCIAWLIYNTTAGASANYLPL